MSVSILVAIIAAICVFFVLEGNDDDMSGAV